MGYIRFGAQNLYRSAVLKIVTGKSGAGPINFTISAFGGRLLVFFVSKPHSIMHLSNILLLPQSSYNACNGGRTTLLQMLSFGHVYIKILAAQIRQTTYIPTSEWVYCPVVNCGKNEWNPAYSMPGKRNGSTQFHFGCVAGRHHRTEREHYRQGNEKIKVWVCCTKISCTELLSKISCTGLIKALCGTVWPSYSKVIHWCGYTIS